MSTKTLIDELNRSVEWIEKCDAAVDGTVLASSDRVRLSSALMHLSMEHNGAIYLLVQRKHNGSALALFRPQFEAYIRATWFFHCASDDQIASFIDTNEVEKIPKIFALIASIEKVNGFNNGQLSRVKDEIIRAMNDYTHGGYSQVVSRITSTEIRSNHQNDRLCELLRASSAFCLLAGIGLLAMADNNESANNLLLAHKELYPEKL